MSPTTQELLKAALLLSPADGIELAGELLESVAAGSPDPEWEAEWQREIARRHRELESGEVQAVAWPDLDREMQQMIDKSGHA